MDGFSNIFYQKNDLKYSPENFSVPERHYAEWSLNGEKKRRAEVKEFIDPERDKRLIQDGSKLCPSPRDVSAMAYPSHSSTSSYSNAASQSRSKDSSILDSPFYPLYSEYAATGYVCDCLKCTSYRSRNNKMVRPVCRYVNSYCPAVSNSRATSSNNAFPFLYTSSLINDSCTVTQTNTTTTSNNNSDTGFDFNGTEIKDKLSCKDDEVDETGTDMMQERDSINKTSPVQDEETILPDSSCLSNKESSPTENNEVIGVSLDALIDRNNSEFQELIKKKEKNSFAPGIADNTKSRDSYDATNGEVQPNLIVSSHNASKRKKEARCNNEKLSIDIQRPPYSYVALIRLAIKASPGKKATLQDIYKYIRENFEYYRKCGSGWQNSIRHNLTVNQCFKRMDNENGRRKGGYWQFKSDHEHEFQNDNWRRRVRMMKRPHLKNQTNSSHNLATTVSPIITPNYHSGHPYPPFWNYSADFFAHSYRSINSGDRNWFSSHMSDTLAHSNQSSLSSYSPCQSLQSTCQSLRMGCVSSTCVDGTTIKASEAPLTLPSSYTANNYGSTDSALPSPQYLRDTTQQTSHQPRPFFNIA